MKKYILFYLFLLLLQIYSFDLNNGYVKFFGQFRYKVEEGNPNTFYIRRLRIAAFDDILKDKITFKAQAELNTGNINLLDLKGSFILNNYFSIDIGRYLVPIDYYTPHSSADLNTIGYPFWDKKYSPWRQEGITLNLKYQFVKVNLGVYNGGGENTYWDKDEEKAYFFRTNIFFIKEINLYFSGYKDNFFQNNQWIKKDLVTTGIYVRDKNLFTLIQAEYTENDELITDKDIFSYGYFIHFSFYIDKIELLARYEFIDNDIKINGAVETHLTIGINYLIKGLGTKFSINYQKNGETSEIPNDKLIFQLQFII